MQESSQIQKKSWLDKPLLDYITINPETALFGIIILLAIITRFYDLGSRVISHDETSHVYYSWRLFRGMGYEHTPLTHGPFQFHIIAFVYYLFGDSDFTARIPVAIFSIAAIAFLWNYRRYLGRTGAIIGALLTLISPYMLYYGRYVRNEAYVAFFGLVTIWAILRYLDTGKPKYLYWLTAATVLHFTTKETSFIYTAQALLLVGFIFLSSVLKKAWEHPKNRNRFLVSLVIGFTMLATTIALRPNQVENEPPVGDANVSELQGEESLPPIPVLLIVPAFIAILAFSGAVYFVIKGVGWDIIRQDRSFGVMVLLSTFVLPQLAPIPIKFLGWNPTDYSFDGMIRTAIVLVPLLIISILIGYAWNPRLWIINAAIFYIPFTILFTTIFTNGRGFFTGLVGSLGYWLEQQGVERGSQPWYYYSFIQIPIYEFLPALGSIFALFLAFKNRILTRDKLQVVESDDQSLTPRDENSYEFSAIFVFGFWTLTSLIAYTIAGEKMPWLTVHIALPMILLAGWSIGKLIDSIDWKIFFNQRGFLIIILLLVLIVSLGSVFGSLLGTTGPFQGKELVQLSATSTFITSLLILIVSGAAIRRLLKHWDISQFSKVVGLSIFAILVVITGRSAFLAAFINYDNATEYLVYAHMARGPKEALEQIEELSVRSTDGLAITVAFDDETTYPYWWYLRNYSNQKFFGANPTRELRDAPVILIGDDNFGKLDPVVGNAYHRFEYIRIWWPNQDYFNVNWSNIESERNRELPADSPPMNVFEYLGRVWGHIKPFFIQPEVREAIWQIWFNRDFEKYADLKGIDMSLPNWTPSNRMRLYVRKDIASQVWNFGSSPVTLDELIADPYDDKGKVFVADFQIGSEGSSQGQLHQPRDIALAPDGSIYVADTGNHRIQHFSKDGRFLHLWGTFADSAVGLAPPGTFYEPWGIAVGSDGSVYVTDTWNHRIQKFTSDGEFLTEWGYFGQGEAGDAFWGPRDIAIDNDGSIFVTDTGNKRVVVFDANGNFITEFGQAGMLAGEFDEPVGITIADDGLVLIADTWNQRIQIFDPSPDKLSYLPIKQLEIYGWFGQSLDNKPSITTDSSGDIYISDPEGYRIIKFDKDGEYRYFWGSFGSTQSDFNIPNGITTDMDDGLWVVDSGNNRVLHYNKTPND